MSNTPPAHITLTTTDSQPAAPIQPQPAVDPQPHRRVAPAVPTISTVASLKRLLPYARPALPSLGGSTLAAVGATLCGLAFPLVIAWIIDGPIAHRQLSQLWAPALVLLGLGVGEAALFWARRMLATRPTMQVEARMRAALYERLQQLPVAFHDSWPAGQLLSRAVSDL